MDTALKGLRETAVDRRALYFRYRQRQLLALYNGVSENREKFVEAVEQDTGKSKFEAELEVSLVLRQLHLQFVDTDFTSLTKRVATLRKSGNIKTPYGRAFILGDISAPLESTLSPLSAAIAAGNVTLVLLPERAAASLRAIEAHIYPALDRSAYPMRLASESDLHAGLSDTFDVMFTTSKNAKVRQQVAEAGHRSSALLHFLPRNASQERQNIAFVSKTAPKDDIARIAKLLARSKFFSDAGKGLGAVSFVCVHEERHDDLVKHLVQATKEFGQQSRSSSGHSDLKEAEGKVVLGNVKTGENTILEKVSTTSSLLNANLERPILPIVPVTSTEEALNTVRDRLGHMLVVFADQLELDYFATELAPPVFLANDLPIEYLAGIHPPALSPEQSTSLRWPSEYFERVITVDRSISSKAQDIFPPFAQWQISALKEQILPNYVKRLALKLKPHSNIIRRVFFLQGLFLSLSIVLGSVVLGGGFTAYSIFKRYSSA